MDEELLVFNGVNGATGGYLTPLLRPDELSQIARGETIDPAHLDDLKFRYRQSQKVYRGPKEGVNPLKLDETGWGVIFAHGSDPAIKEAISPLLQLRRSQAWDLYKEFDGLSAYRPGESKIRFLQRHKVGSGPVDPSRVPYYLLIIGSPEEIPYRFQYQLDVAFAVGRIDFDSLDEYATYAQSVVKSETGAVLRPRKATFFGVQNPNDRSTHLSATQLVQPLASRMAADQPAWQITAVSGEDATKASLSQHFGGPDTPALLFTASHGVGFPSGHPRQLPHQGALLCQDWPGPLASPEAVAEEYYFSASGIAKEARLGGLIAFHFACYGGGTPKMDYFAQKAFREPELLAPFAFTARLPQKTLSHPRGGALAVIGHVDRTWTYSFYSQQAGAQLQTFESSLKRLMEGHPVGSAMEYFNLRYAELSTELSDRTDISFWEPADDLELASLWTANNDARSYVIIGDPAVRLPVEGEDQPVMRRTARRLHDPKPRRVTRGGR